MRFQAIIIKSFGVRVTRFRAVIVKTLGYRQNSERGLHKGFTSDLGSRNSFPREEQVAGDVRRKAAGEGTFLFPVNCPSMSLSEGLYSSSFSVSSKIFAAVQI